MEPTPPEFCLAGSLPTELAGWAESKQPPLINRHNDHSIIYVHEVMVHVHVYTHMYINTVMYMYLSQELMSSSFIPTTPFPSPPLSPPPLSLPPPTLPPPPLPPLPPSPLAGRTLTAPAGTLDSSSSWGLNLLAVPWLWAPTQEQCTLTQVKWRVDKPLKQHFPMKTEQPLISWADALHTRIGKASYMYKTTMREKWKSYIYTVYVHCTCTCICTL